MYCVHTLQPTSLSLPSHFCRQPVIFPASLPLTPLLLFHSLLSPSLFLSFSEGCHSGCVFMIVMDISYTEDCAHNTIPHPLTPTPQ